MARLHMQKTLDPFSDWIPDYKRRGEGEDDR